MADDLRALDPINNKAGDTTARELLSIRNLFGEISNITTKDPTVYKKPQRIEFADVRKWDDFTAMNIDRAFGDILIEPVPYDKVFGDAAEAMSKSSIIDTELNVRQMFKNGPQKVLEVIFTRIMDKAQTITNEHPTDRGSGLSCRYFIEHDRSILVPNENPRARREHLKPNVSVVAKVKKLKGREFVHVVGDFSRTAALNQDMLNSKKFHEYAANTFGKLALWAEVAKTCFGFVVTNSGVWAVRFHTLPSQQDQTRKGIEYKFVP